MFMVRVGHDLAVKGDRQQYFPARLVWTARGPEAVCVEAHGSADLVAGARADGALAEGGDVIGILPRFMRELEWAHPGISELRLVDDMQSRKRLIR